MKRLLLLASGLSLLIIASAAQAQVPIPIKMRPAKATERQAAINSIQAQLKALAEMITRRP